MRSSLTRAHPSALSFGGNELGRGGVVCLGGSLMRTRRISQNREEKKWKGSKKMKISVPRSALDRTIFVSPKLRLNLENPPGHVVAPWYYFSRARQARRGLTPTKKEVRIILVWLTPVHHPCVTLRTLSARNDNFCFFAPLLTQAFIARSG